MESTSPSSRLSRALSVQPRRIPRDESFNEQEISDQGNIQFLRRWSFLDPGREMKL